jgi:hypothetical protein
MATAVRLIARRWFLGLIALPLLFLPVEANSPHQQKRKGSNDSEPIDVGMVALLASPQKYDGKLIRTIGFMCIEFENDALYLHEEDYRYGENKNSFSLRLSESQRKQFKELSLNRVVIEAKVYANGLEATDWAGALGNIKRLELWRVDRGPVPHQ